MTLTILPRKAANTLIMGKSRSIALGLYKMQLPKSKTLCWRSILGVASSTLTILPIQEANTVIMCKSRPLDYTRCNTQNCWRSVDAHFQHGAVIMSLSLLPIKAANMLIMDNSDQITSQTTYFHGQQSLPLGWCPFPEFGCDRVAFSLSIMGADTLVMANSEQITSQLTYLQDQMLITLHWRSFSECGCYRVAVSSTYIGCQYVD